MQDSFDGDFLRKNFLNKSDYLKAYYQKNKEKIKARTKLYLENNLEKIRLVKKDYYQANRREFILAATVRNQANPHRHDIYRKSHLKKTYGISFEEFDALLVKQGNGCAICQTSVPGGKGTWHIDHDHSCCSGRKSCGKCIRGLLCQRCNAGLGHFGDNRESLRKAISYLEK